jgi:hypothetical protein
MTIYQALVWFATAAGSAAALSFIAERIPSFQTLSETTKSNVHLFGSMIIALASYAILTYTPQDVLSAIAPWFTVVYGVFVTWMANQLAHKNDPKAQ